MKTDDIEAAINLPNYALKLLAQKDAEIAGLTAANTYHELQLDRAREEIGRLRGVIEFYANRQTDGGVKARQALDGDSHDN